MNDIDVLDNGIRVNGNDLIFPLSYDEIKAALGETRLVRDIRFRNNSLFITH